MSMVSIIVPVYNVSNYLDMCVNSLIRQTFYDIEIIIVDDGSTDGSSEICDKWLMIDNRIRVIHQKNQGVSVARNNGLEIATGEWISFVDGDDYVPEDMIEKLLEEATKSKRIDLVIGSYYSDENSIINREHFFKGNKIIEFDKKEILVMMAVGMNITDSVGTTNIGVPWSKLYRKCAIDKNELSFQVDLRRMQDTVFNISFFRVAREIRYIDIPIYYYRINSNSAVRRYYEDFEQIAQNIIVSLEQQIYMYDNIEHKDAIIKYKKISLVNETIKLSYVHKKCNLPLKQKIENIERICKLPLYYDAVYDDSNLYLNRKYIIFKKILKLKLYWLAYAVIWIKHHLSFENIKLNKLYVFNKYLCDKRYI